LSDKTFDKSASSSVLKGWSKFSIKLLNKKKSRSAEQHLKLAFYEVHRKFLKQYQNHSSLSALLEEGLYDCLSGTSLYVLLLEELGYDYKIRETDYHIYLLVEGGEANSSQQFLFESTDPVSGFISDKKEILKREEQYQSAWAEDGNGVQGIATATLEYQFSRKVNNDINRYQLAGLHYYNQGIYAYNNHNYYEAVSSLQKALFLYDSPRIREFLDLTVSVGLNSDMDMAEKEKIRQLHQEWQAAFEKNMAQNN